jgi:adenylate cyclase
MAREAFRQAIALDPAFAQAQAGLADADFMLLQWNLDLEHAGEIRAEGLAASEEALRLEPELAEARLARANVLTLLGRTAEAERDFLHARELNPGWGDACYFHGRALVGAGRLDEAAAAFEEAARRNPDDFSAACLLVNVHEHRRDQEAARRAAGRALEAVERRLRLDPDDERALYLGAGVDIDYGDRARGFQRIERAISLMDDDFATLYNAACFYTTAGEPGRALDLLDRAVATGRGFRQWIEQDSDLDALRSDPRFQAILARVVS